MIHLPMSRFARPFTLAFAFILSATLAPQAQQVASPPLMPSHLAVATDVLRHSGIVTMFTNSMPNVVGGLRANITRARPELTKDIEEALKVVEAELPSAIEEGLSESAGFLAAKMSEPELKEVLAFLTSAAGKKYVATLPGFMDEVVPYLQIWTQAVGQGATRRFGDEMAKRGHKL
jgi:uncharacterized protein